MTTRTLGPIAHGTLTGYNQHRNRRVPIPETDECGCRAAFTASRRERAAARASRSAHEWNRGLTGERPPIPSRPLATACPTAACGQDVAAPEVAGPGWVYARVIGSAEPGRWYCSGSCSTYGIALAELRPAEGGTR
ncbi:MULTISPECIES: hypothetical protein [Streptomycetaceae]|uniref:hypothetical protein n=1 Tax=Streptomycetaceae TaxID=2062 RepID=UPI000963635D|nr:hypothetical protein [Streptomyces sp. CB02056]OKI08807.1 hypothetical protein AMK13_10425 [Streptomyces sp. CB02056]